jgi:hypothetical protein
MAGILYRIMAVTGAVAVGWRTVVILEAARMFQSFTAKIGSK